MGREVFFSRIFLIALILALAIPGTASALSATMNQVVYVWGGTLSVSGTAGGTTAVVVSATVYNSTGFVRTLSATSSGGASNVFSISSSINASSYPAGSYAAIISDGSSSVNMSLKVIAEKIAFEPYMINSSKDIINITTTTIISTDNALGGNFGELRNLSKTGTLHYGNYSLNGEIYHFVLVDQTNSSNYDRLYIDDDKIFQLSNDTEDSSDIEYQALKKSSVFDNGTFRYVIGDIERTTGDEVILWKPMEKAPTNADNISFVILAKNDTEMLSEPVKVEVYNSSGHNVTPAYYLNTSDAGWLNLSIPNLTAGTYTIKLNDSMASLSFSVESFKMFATIADTSNNPSYSFSPNSKVRLIITSKNAIGPFNLTSFTATLNYPGGTTLSKTESDFTQTADGVYYYDYDATATGRYGISITGSDGTASQTTYAGFEVRSVGFEAMAINTRYIEEADSTGAVVDAFPPNTNVTIMTFLTNITAGGKFAKGPEGMMEGLVDPGNCSARITLSEVEDENGASYSVSPVVMNLSSAITYLGIAGGGEQPPQQMRSQCMLIFPAPNKNGSTYKAEIKMNYNGEERYAGVSFGVQRLLARGSTVDFKGEDFGFFAPNSTVRIKLKVTDLATDQELPAGNITSAKIIGLYQMFPSYKDVLGNSTLRGTLNENITNGTISFTSPLDEGFYSMKFRFSANIGGSTETGIGDAFFMLKKYMVWGQLAGASQGQWFARQGQNITLTVTVMDISNAEFAFGGYSTQKSCTGCGGFVINVSELRNDQQFKTVTGYTVQTGTIINSTNPVANITIIPGPDMQSGWYSADLTVTDPATNATYFGWGGFEIRNFWVDVQKAYWNSTSSRYFVVDTHEGGGMSGASFEVGQAVAFAVFPRRPMSPDILSASSVTLDSVQSSAGWPPAPISGYSASANKQTIDYCQPVDKGEPICTPSTDKYVVVISGLPAKQGEYIANVRVTAEGTSDIGTFRFSTSSYDMWVDYRRDSYPPLYAATENLSVNFTGLTLSNKDPYNLTNVTIEDMFDTKRGRPIKMKFGQNYTTNCNLTKVQYGKTWQYCQTNVNLTNLQSGEYVARFSIVDSPSATDQKTKEVFFKVQDAVVGIPSIEDAWVWQTDAVSKKMEQDVRRGEWSNCEKSSGPVNTSRFCGDYNPPCQGEGPCQPQQFNLTVQNVSSSKEIFGYIPVVNEGSAGRFGSVTNKSRICIYANGSHLWINATAFNSSTNACDLRQTQQIAVNGTFADSKGGIWRLDTIGDQSITLTGLNTVYETGVLINTSYSKSGIIKVGQLQESNLGAFTKDENGGARKGVDLDGDGFANGTAYFAIADNATSGVYDTFFFSTDGNFTSPTSGPMSVNDVNRTSREFGKGAEKDRLTLLSIDPKGQQLKFYSKQVGDWAHMGDIRLSTNITIPVIVASPDGTSRSTNVSITRYKNMRSWQTTPSALVSNQNITGVGELRFNTSTLGTGEFSFAIETSSGDKVDEWRWPMATVRGFLVDGEMGEAMYITGFRQLPLQWKNWNDGITRVQSDRQNISNVVDGVLAWAHPFPYDGPGCKYSNSTGWVLFNDPDYNANITPYLVEDSFGPPVYYFYNSTSQTLYQNATGCTFNITNAPSYQVGSTLTLDKDGRNYNVSILKINVYQPTGCNPWDCWRASFGVAGINSSVILPMANNTQGDPQWSIEWGYMQNVSIFGSYYDVILANDTYNYQRCALEQSQDRACAKKAWIVPTSVGNFSNPQAKNITIGQNFTADLYLASVGPKEWDGITVGNFSLFAGLPLPAIGMLPLADGAPGYFVALNESVLRYDFDKNSSANKTFYMLAFDADFNGVKSPTSNVIDDDLEMLMGSLNIGGNETPYDFTGAENGTDERWGGLPTGLWSGNAQFGPQQDGVMWESQPNWDVPFFNNTHMLLRKSKWKVEQNQPVDVLLKVFNFNQQPISGANISIMQVARATWMGFQKLDASQYIANTTYNVTDQYGYGIIKLSPNVTNGTWGSGGNYQVVLNIQTAQGNETFERWFCVGNCGW